jgi:methylenetetrahydrofolate dehydrogenase (NADP+)/methenyltetrahydrofolate cyclohydrolase
MEQFLDGNVILGNLYAENIRQSVKTDVENFRNQTGIVPNLTVVLIGNNPASKIYVQNKKKFAIECGMKSQDIFFDESISEGELLFEIQRLNNDSTVHGILVQMPLPRNINANVVINAIDPRKDVDGFHIQNVGKLFTNTIDSTSLLPCTPLGCMHILESLEPNLRGKSAVVIGTSNIVGRPMTAMLLNKGATVSVLNSSTKDKQHYTKNADIIIVACGVPNVLNAQDISNPIILDVGINRLENGKVVGDCNFESCKTKAKFITPVPKGIGPMTIAMLLQNTLKACISQNK